MKNNIFSIGLIGLILISVSLPSQAEGYRSDSISQRNLTFNQFLKTIEINNLEYIAQKFNINISEAGIVASKVMPDPELTFEAKDESFTVELGYDLELGNKRGARVALAKSEAALSKLAVEQFFRDLRAESANAYIDAIANRELFDLKKRSHAYILQLSQSDSIRFTLGEISENDARQSKLEAATMLNEVYQQEAEYMASLAMLNRYMGLSTDTLSNPIGEWSWLKRNYILSDLIQDAIINRVDLEMAIRSSEVASNQLRLAKSERALNLGLMVGYERDWHGFFPKGNTIKGGVTVPLPLSNMNRGAAKAAKFAKEQSEYEYKGTKLEIETEVTQAFFFFEASKKQVKQYQTGLLEDSKQVLEGMVYRYRRGETNILDVLIAQRTYNEVQEQYIETMKNYVATLVNLEKACGAWDIDF